MSITAVRAALKLEAETADAEKQLKASADRMKGDLKSVGTGGKEAGQKWSKEFAGSMKDAVLSMAAGFVSAKFILSGINLTSTIEQANVAFKVMMKDADAAKKTVQSLYEYAAHTPFEFPEILQAGLMLKSFSVDLTKWIPLIGDWTAAMQAAGATMSETSRAIGFIAGGRFGEAFESMARLGIARTDLLLAGLKFDKGGSFTGSAKQAMDALEKIIKEKFGGMAEEQSKTFAGMLSTIKDSINQFAATMTLPIFNSLKGLFNWILGQTASTQQAIMTAAVGAGSAILIALGGPMSKVLGIAMLIIDALSVISDKTHAAQIANMELAGKSITEAFNYENLVTGTYPGYNEAIYQGLELAQGRGEPGYAYDVWEGKIAAGKKVAADAAAAQALQDQLDALSAGIGTGAGGGGVGSAVEDATVAVRNFGANFNHTAEQAIKNEKELNKALAANLALHIKSGAEAFVDVKAWTEAYTKQKELVEEMGKAMEIKAPAGGQYGSLGAMLDSITGKLGTFSDMVAKGFPAIMPSFDKAQQYLMNQLDTGWLEQFLNSNVTNPVQIEQTMSDLLAGANKPLYESLNLKIPWETFRLLPGPIQEFVLKIAEYRAAQDQFKVTIDSMRVSVTTQATASTVFAGAVTSFVGAVAGAVSVVTAASYGGVAGGGRPPSMFAGGGLVRTPTLGWIGEGRESEYIVPAKSFQGMMQEVIAAVKGIRSMELNQRLAVEVEVSPNSLIRLAAKGVRART